MPGSKRRLRLCLLTEGDPGQLTGGYLYQQRMAAAAPEHGFEIDFLSIPRRALALEIADGRRLLRRPVGGDALLVDSLVAAAAAPWLGGVAQRTPVIGLVFQQPGGADHGPARTAIQRRLDRRAYQQSHGVVAVSDFLAMALRRAGIASSRIHVIPPGRDLVAAAPASEQDLRQGRETALLCVSNWRRNKGIDLILEALARLRPRMATLHLVGNTTAEPAYERALRARIARPDLRTRVVVHGPVAPAAVGSLLGSADLFVHASRQEAYGAAVAEAMAAGLPVVAFDVDNLSYLVRDRMDGILLPFGDLPALAAALALLIGDPKRRAEMAASARKRAMAFPTWAESADSFFGAIRQMLPAESSD